MTGEELKRRLDGIGISQAEIARRMGVFPQSLNMTFKAADVKSSIIEKLCKVLGKDMSFFYDTPSKDIELERLRKENRQLHDLITKIKEEIRANEK